MSVISVPWHVTSSMTFNVIAASSTTKSNRSGFSARLSALAAAGIYLMKDAEAVEQDDGPPALAASFGMEFACC